MSPTCGPSYLLVSGPESEDLNELVEHQPVRDAGPALGLRVRVDDLVNHSLKLAPHGFDGKWKSRHERS